MLAGGEVAVAEVDAEGVFGGDDPVLDAAAGEGCAPFRPDALVYLDRPTWRSDIAELAKVSGRDTGTYDGFLEGRDEYKAYCETSDRC